MKEQLGISAPRGLDECRLAVASACEAVGVQFPSDLLEHYEGMARHKFEAHAWTWESRRALVMLSARWVGRLAGELAMRDNRTTVSSKDAELAFTIAREVCYARAPASSHRLDWCPDGRSPGYPRGFAAQQTPLPMSEWPLNAVPEIGQARQMRDEAVR